MLLELGKDLKEVASEMRQAVKETSLGFKELAVSKAADTSNVKLGVVSSGVAPNNRNTATAETVATVSKDSDESKILEKIAENTEKTADNTTKPVSSGGQADAGPSEEQIKAKLKDDKSDQKGVLSKIAEKAGDISNALLAFGATAAVLSTNSEESKSLMEQLRSGIDTFTDRLSTFVSENPGTAAAIGAGTVATAAAGLKARDMLVGKDPKGSTRNKAGRLQGKDGKFIKDPKTAAKARRANLGGKAIRAAKFVGKGALRVAGPVGLAASAVVGGAAAGQALYDNSETVRSAGQAVGGAIANTLGTDQGANEGNIAGLQAEFEGIGKSAVMTSGLPEERQEQYLKILENVAATGNEQQYASLMEAMMKEASGNKATPNNTVVTPTDRTSGLETATNTVEQVRAAEQKQVISALDAIERKSVPAPIGGGQAEGESIATTIAIDKAARNGVAERLARLDTIAIPKGY